MKTTIESVELFPILELHVLHTAMDKPPEMRKAPEKAHVRLLYISFGVISL
jgi:hypothetical protein